MALYQVTDIAGDHHEVPDAGPDAGLDNAVDEGAPRDLEKGLALRAAGQAPTPAGRDDKAFHRRLS